MNLYKNHLYSNSKNENPFNKLSVLGPENLGSRC